MKPVLVLALGNPLVGDDGVGGGLARLAAADPEISARADVINAGTDLFRQATQLPGRQRIIIVDAALTTAAVSAVRVVPHPPPAADRRSSAHALDPVAAVQLLRSVLPEVAAVAIWWLLIEVPEIRSGPGVSPASGALLPQALAALRELVSGAASEPLPPRPVR
jgi:hydrogenase maturation protease